MALTVTGATSFRPAKRQGLHSTPSLNFLEAASQTFKIGSPLTFTTGGSTVELCASTTNPVNIIGFSAEDASGTTNNPIRIWPLADGVIWEAELGTAALTDVTLAQTQVGDVYGIARDGTNLGYFIDTANTAVLQVKVRIVGLKDAVGTVNGRVYCTFFDFVMDTDAAVGSQIAIVNAWKVYGATS
jgi:hypothetical protein